MSSKYQAWADELEKSGLAPHRLQWFRGRFVEQLEYHTANSRRSKSRYLWLAVSIGLVPIVANTVMSLSSTHDKWLRFGITCGILAVGLGAALTLFQTIWNNQQNWQASRELAEELKAQYWDLIGDETSDFNARWVNFHNDVEKLLASELRSFGSRAKVAQIAAARLQRQQETKLTATVEGTQVVVEPVKEKPVELTPVATEEWAKWQETQLADEEFADVTQELPRGIR